MMAEEYKIVRNKMEVYEEPIVCDCGGELNPTGEVLLTYPGLYPYICNKCRKITNWDKANPSISYETIS